MEKQMIKAQWAVAKAMEKAAGILKGYAATFDELQRVSVKTPSAKATKKELQDAAELASWIEPLLERAQVKARTVVALAAEVADPFRRLNLTSVDTQLKELAAQSATVGGAMAGAAAVASQGWHNALNRLKDAQLQAELEQRQRWLEMGDFLASQVVQPLDGGFRDLGKNMASYMGEAVKAVAASVKAVADTVAKVQNIQIKLPNIGKTISLPGLARGAVLPANQPFLAVVGDQKRGTNVEAPLSVIQEAVGSVMDGYAAASLAGQEATVGVLQDILQAVLGIEIGDTAVAQAVQRYNEKRSVMRGSV